MLGGLARLFNGRNLVLVLAGRFSAYLLPEVLGTSVNSPKSIHNSIVGGESQHTFIVLERGK